MLPDITSAYLHPCFNYESLGVICGHLEKNIINSKIDFDCIAFRGFSGSLVAPVLSLMLKKNLILIRKKSNDTTHSWEYKEGYINPKNSYIICDDFCEEGNTIKSIVSELKGKLKGIFLYKDSKCDVQIKGILGKKFSEIPIYSFFYDWQKSRITWINGDNDLTKF